MRAALTGDVESRTAQVRKLEVESERNARRTGQAVPVQVYSELRDEMQTRLVRVLEERDRHHAEVREQQRTVKDNEELIVTLQQENSWAVSGAPEEMTMEPREPSVDWLGELCKSLSAADGCQAITARICERLECLFWHGGAVPSTSERPSSGNRGAEFLARNLCRRRARRCRAENGAC